MANLTINNLKAFSEENMDRLMTTLSPIEYMYTKLVLFGMENNQIRLICKINEVEEKLIIMTVEEKINNVLTEIKSTIKNSAIERFGGIEAIETALTGLPANTQYTIIKAYNFDGDYRSFTQISKDLGIPLSDVMVHFNNGTRYLEMYI